MEPIHGIGTANKAAIAYEGVASDRHTTKRWKLRDASQAGYIGQKSDGGKERKKGWFGVSSYRAGGYRGWNKHC